ncbi:MAG: aminotransferase class III-fold pyridoxal phosphate-dependent enzyme, partial [Paracoccaceae bacterium]
VTRPDIMAEFREAFGYFNTFGGNPVSAAAAMATMQVIEEEGLVENARFVGAYALDRMRALKHPLIAQVRGQGLFFALEFVDRGEPAADFTHRVVEGMKREGVLVGSVGRHGNILKLRPPLVFSRENADLAIDTLDKVLREAHDER